MTIGWTSYGIHGTNNPWSVGREATHGCVRLQEQDIKRLFERIPESTPPRIVYEPFKWGTDGENIVFEAYPDLYQHKSDPLASALTPVREQGLLDFVEIEKVWDALEAARGTPVTVERLPARPSP